MTDKLTIQVQNLCKTFRLYPSRRSRMLELVHPLRHKFHKKFHALKDINFSVEKGEVLGLIGQNGSGKSTMLKILSSVVTQTSGSFYCQGRVTALLELGGGFNMDLTGVENVFFLGAIQGYSKKEMAGRLQEILDFADIGDYAWQPVSSYSSGMYVRLAFSININIDPDILIIDEALAVGDVRFQQKCYRKIRDFKDAGKTIVFCTHSLTAVKDFCTRAIWIHLGEMIEDGDPQIVTEKYQTFMSQLDVVNKTKKIEGELTETPDGIPAYLLHPLNKDYKWYDMNNYQSSGSGEVFIRYATLIDTKTNQSISFVKGGENLRLRCIIEADENLNHPGLQVKLNGQFGSTVLIINSYYYENNLAFEINKTTFVDVDFQIPDLGNGYYSFSLAALDMVEGATKYIHWVYDALLIEVDNPDVKYKLATQFVVKDALIHSFPELS